MTVQPARRKRAWLRASRRRFASIFASHFSESLSLQVGKRQPCQKSPSTNTATFARRTEKSGRPGRSQTCVSNCLRGQLPSETTRVFDRHGYDDENFEALGNVEAQVRALVSGGAVENVTPLRA